MKRRSRKTGVAPVSDSAENRRFMTRNAELQFGSFGYRRSSGFAPNWNSALRRQGRKAR